MRARFRQGNRITLLETGQAYFPALLEALDRARREIWLETYIYDNDPVGREITAALVRAAERDVMVRVVVDGFGSPRFMQDFGNFLREHDVEVLIYRPEIKLFRLRRNRLRRLHRKLVCVDGGVGFAGGININDEVKLPGHTAPRLDYAVRVEGPVVDDMRATMEQVWGILRWASLGHRYPMPQRPLVEAPNRDAATDLAGDVEAALLVRDNLRHRRDIEHAYLAAIHLAKEEIIIANAYFLPGRRFRRALLAAAKRGVKVTVLSQGKIEYRLQYFATRALYAQMLEGGIRVYEFRPSFLHAKVAVVDGVWATVGSSNIDPFSLLLAREANVVVRDRAVAGELHASLQRAISEGSDEITDWVHQAWYQRVASWTAYGVVRFLVGVAGYSTLL